MKSLKWKGSGEHAFSYLLSHEVILQFKGHTVWLLIGEEEDTSKCC